jgi:PIN domain nuclease of toxin-antitoxin system
MAKSEYVTDTHPLVWHLAHDARLSPRAAAVFQRADCGKARVWVPSIALIEIRYLYEKGKIGCSEWMRATSALSQLDETSSYAIAPLDWAIARMMEEVPRSAVTDMPDRIIVATARHLGLPLLSKDQQILRANLVPVIW